MQYQGRFMPCQGRVMSYQGRFMSCQGHMQNRKSENEVYRGQAVL